MPIPHPNGVLRNVPPHSVTWRCIVCACNRRIQNGLVELQETVVRVCPFLLTANTPIEHSVNTLRTSTSDKR